jgi:hypothetical protein
VSGLLDKIRRLVASGNRTITAHAHKRLADHNVMLRDALEGVVGAIELEAYPEYYAGPALLCLQSDGNGQAIHVVWGMPAAGEPRAYMITAYRPDPPNGRMASRGEGQNHG